MLSFFNKSGEEGREKKIPSQKPKYFRERGGTHFWETKSRATKSKTKKEHKKQKENNQYHPGCDILHIPSPSRSEK
jgi:hypothetical protein